MEKYRIGRKALRMTLLSSGVVIWPGIWLTGFGVAHWVLYIPAAALVSAGITGICPVLIVNKLSFR